MLRLIKKLSLKPFFMAVLIAVLLLPTVSCISGAEGDLVESILANVDTVDGEAVFHTKDGRTITITVTGESQEDTANNEEEPTQTCDENKEKQDDNSKENLADILPKVDSIENIFKTLGVWEQACELHDKGLTWAHIAAELGFDSETMYRELQEEIELPPVAEIVQEEAGKFAGIIKQNGRLMFTIETLDGMAVGGLNLNRIDERNGTFGIGIQINIDYRGKGYGTAAMRILLKYAFLERRLNKFNVWCVEGNMPAITMMKKLGCTQEGVRRQIIYSDGRYIDGILFGLTKDEFIKNERKFVLDK